MAKIDPKLVQQTTQLKQTAKTAETKSVAVDTKTQENMNTLVQKFMLGGIDAKQFQAEAQKLGMGKNQITVVQNQQKILNDPKTKAELQKLLQQLLKGDLNYAKFTEQATKLGLPKEAIEECGKQAEAQIKMRLFVADKAQSADLREAVSKYSNIQSPSLADIEAINDAFLKTSSDPKLQKNAEKVAKALSALNAAVANRDVMAIEDAVNDVNALLDEKNEDDGGGVQEPACYATWRQIIAHGVAHIIGGIIGCGTVGSFYFAMIVAPMIDAGLGLLMPDGNGQNCKGLDNHAIACGKDGNAFIGDGCNINGTHANNNYQQGLCN